MVLRATCYSIKQRSNVVALLLQKEANNTMQWSHAKTFEFVFYCFHCLTSIFLFCFVIIRQILMFFTNFLSFLIKKKNKKKCTFHHLSLTKYTVIKWKRRRKKLTFSWLQDVILLPNFSLVLNAIMY